MVLQTEEKRTFGVDQISLTQIVALLGAFYSVRIFNSFYVPWSEILQWITILIFFA